MENLTLDKDIYLICVRAISFPDGIKDAMVKLQQIDSSIANRTLYGISHGSDTGVIYWAAVEEGFKGEGYTFGLEQYTIKKGVYACKELKNIKGKEHKIGEAFNELLEHPQLDEMGECIERYKNENEVLCMVRILK
jgi:hypothetical protein